MSPSELAFDSLYRLDGVDATYVRRGESRSVRALMMSTEAETITADGSAALVRTIDFIFLAAELGLEPQRGDAIHVGDRAFEVVASPGGAPFEYREPQRYTMRVPTNEQRSK